MKRKILMLLLLVCPFFINACSCDKFDIHTYEAAVKNYKNSTGLDYTLTITTYTDGDNMYYLEESKNQYQFSTTKEVENFASEIKKYEVVTNNQTGDGAPNKVFELNRYYISEEYRFYTNEIGENINKKQVEYVSYEGKYDETSIYHINNLVPMFNIDFITEFKIEKYGANKGYSVASFVSSCPTFATCESDHINYKVIIDRDFYFDSIEFSIVNKVPKTVTNELGIEEIKEFDHTITYKYKFKNYNNNVEIDFPNDLGNY